MNVAIIGATGYSGVELIRLLIQHPFVNIHSVISTSAEGKSMSEIYPHLSYVFHHDLIALDVEQIASLAELVFFATPSGVSKDLIPAFLKRGVKCIDLSGDFRLRDAEEYENWYKHSAANSNLLQEAIYGLCEINFEKIRKASLLANPGCYPTATLLALIPMLQEQWIDPQSIIIDGKSGVSGAGRTPSLNTMFAEVNENIKAYKLGAHQHVPEIEQLLTDISGTNIQVTFSTHLIPMTRGIMCTIYTNLLVEKNTQDIIDHYQAFYKDQPFVRIRPEGTWPSTKEVYGSNYCDLGFLVDSRTNRLTIVSVIDNVVKGAVGQAIQNMNLMYGWDVRTGLQGTPIYP